MGLPTLARRNKKRMFGHRKERVYGKLKCWKNRSMSKAGKEVLLKVVV